MKRLVLFTALALAACGSDDNSADNSTNANATANSNTNSASNANAGYVNARADLVESADCFAEPAALMLMGPEIDYVNETEADLQQPRSDYGAFCGSVMFAEIDWEAFLASTGFDDDEIENSGAITAGMIPFLEGAGAYCEGADGAKYRDGVSRVIITATDTPARVGTCFDADAAVLVNRFMLDPDATTATQVDAAEITTWLTDNLP